MNKTCRHNTLLHSLMDNELSDKKKRFMEEHLQECALCQAEKASLSTLSGLLKELDDVELSNGFNRSFWNKVDDYEGKKLSGFFGGRVAGRWRIVFAPLLVTLILISGIFMLKKPMTMNYDDIILVEHMDLLDDFDVVNNLDLIENMDVLNQMKEAS